MLLCSVVAAVHCITREDSGGFYSACRFCYASVLLIALYSGTYTRYHLHPNPTHGREHYVCLPYLCIGQGANHFRLFKASVHVDSC